MESNTQFRRVEPIADATDELRKIASDIQEYMGKWVVRSRRVMEHASESMHGDVGFSHQRQKFEEQQHKWEAKRQREMDEIAEKAEELAAAWLRLESEQRLFLQMKESWHRRSSQTRAVDHVQTDSNDTSSNSIAANPPAIANEQPAHLTAAPVRSPKVAPQTAPRFPVNHISNQAHIPSDTARDAAIRQFEQLRREVAAKRGS